MIQQNLILIKPDGLVKSLTGNILTALSETKLKIVASKVVKVSRQLAENHYHKLKGELIVRHGKEKGSDIYENTIKYIMGEFHTDRVLALVYHGEDAIKKVREIVGETNPEKASPVSIRGKYGRINSQTGVFETVVHSSDNEKTAGREIKLWFSPEELTEKIYPVKKEKFESERTIWA
jgi:nucleoside-diphosphate kinase